jgi:hypothetical protein
MVIFMKGAIKMEGFMDRLYYIIIFMVSINMKVVLFEILIIQGYFDNGKKEGLGREDYISGGFYEGYFKAGLKHGEGKLTFNDGSYYMGDF